MGIASYSGASSVIKPGVVTSSTRPSSPFVGQLIYETDTARLAAYNGSAWVSQNSLQLVKSQTVGTAVSSVTVTDAFSATYDAYRIIAAGVAGSGNGNVTFQLTGLTTGYSGNLISANYASGAPASSGYNNIASITHGAGVDLTSLHLDIDIDGPFLARPTFIICKYIDGASSGVATVKQTSSTSTTGFTITAPSTSTFTGGTIRVYGYANS